MCRPCCRTRRCGPEGSGPATACRCWAGWHDANQLELLSAPAAVRALDAAELLVVAVARNERTLLPHFLDHYRKLGVQHFVLVDNLSDDGTREYLLLQPDVVLYSADTEYRALPLRRVVAAGGGWPPTAGTAGSFWPTSTSS